MKKLFFLTIAAIAAVFCGCTTDKGGDALLYADFTINPNPCYASEVVTFTNTTNSATSCTWEIIDIDTNTSLDVLRGELVGGKLQATYSFISNGTYRVKMTASNGSTSVEKVKILVVNPAKLEDTGDLVLNWCGVLEGYSSKTSPAVTASGEVYATCNDNLLRKFDAQGNQLWSLKLASQSGTSCTPAIDTDGTVYIGSGTDKGYGVYVAVNPDGTEKWRFTNFYVSTSHGTLLPAVNGQHVAIDETCVYGGNNGNTGSVIAINKADGTRLGYAAGANGGGGPAGGVVAGVVLNKSGYINWSGGTYGIFSMAGVALKNANNSNSNEWNRVFSSAPYSPTANATGNLACVNVGGIDCVCGVMTDGIGTNVYAVDSENGIVVSQVYISNTDAQDQGGVAITADGYAVASLNNTLGKANGGIAIVDLAKEQVIARFSTMEKVSGSPAVDAAGNIHFGTESGHYYIVKLKDAVSGEFELLVKRNIGILLANDSRYASHYEGLEYPKVWSSPAIGPDGKIYVNFADDERRDAVSGGALSGVLCLSYEGCTGAAVSSWPMHGGNHRRCGVQQ